MAGARKRRAVMAIAAMLILNGCEKAGATGAVDNSPSQPAEKPATGEQGRKQTFAAWLDDLKAEARTTRGIRPDILEQAFAGVSPLPRVLERDRTQPEMTLTFQDYLSRTVTAARVATGCKKMAAHRQILAEIDRAFGVPPRFIVALWGIESDFGRLTGGFPVVGALATLAHEGRRSAYFRQELLDALTILDQGHITAERMHGSWAGAMGQNQFMPSSFLRFAKDHDGDGRRDIWNTEADVFASTANYLATLGWKDDHGWGRAVRLPERFDSTLAARKVKKTLSGWTALGVTGTDGRPLPNKSIAALLVLPDGNAAPAFLVYDNYGILLQWNRSNLFALVVGYLADRLQAR